MRHPAPSSAHCVRRLLAWGLGLLILLTLAPPAIAAPATVRVGSWQGTLVTDPDPLVFNAHYAIRLDLRSFDPMVSTPLPLNLSVRLFAIAPSQTVPTTASALQSLEQIPLSRTTADANRWKGDDLRPSAGVWSLIALVNGTVLLSFPLEVGSGEGISWTLLAIIGLIVVPVVVIALVLSLRRRRHRDRLTARRRKGQPSSGSEGDE